MTPLQIKYRTYANALPPQPIRLANVDWAGAPSKMENGSEPQPWHCLPFVEGSTYGLELIYPHEQDCQVVNDNGAVRFDWDFAREPGGQVTGGEFRLFDPTHASKFYLFNTRTDIVPPPGHVIRTEPHPRYFTDETGTVPLAMIGHLQNEWYPRLLFVVFRAPRPGQRAIFRRGEPFAQLIFVPQRAAYDLTALPADEEERRRERERSIEAARFEIATNVWSNADGSAFNNHYKVLARAFARERVGGVDEAIRQGLAKHAGLVPRDRPIGEIVAAGHEALRSFKFQLAEEIYTEALQRDPNNAEALSSLGICVGYLGYPTRGLQLMTQAVSLEPTSARYHSNLGECLAQHGRLPEAESSFRRALQLRPNDPVALSALGLVLAMRGRVPEGLQACRAALAMTPAVPDAPYRLGLILEQQGQPHEARAQFEMALQLDSGFLPAQRALAALPAG